jgi:hypothetical protein
MTKPTYWVSMTAVILSLAVSSSTFWQNNIVIAAEKQRQRWELLRVQSSLVNFAGHERSHLESIRFPADKQSVELGAQNDRCADKQSVELGDQNDRC